MPRREDSLLVRGMVQGPHQRESGIHAIPLWLTRSRQLSRYATPIGVDRMFIVLAGGHSRIFGPTETTQEVRNSVEWLLGHLGFLRQRNAHAGQRNKNHHNSGEFHRRPALFK